MKNSTGDIIQRCTSDIDTLKNFISEQLTGILRVVILLALSVGFMFSMNARLAWIALAPVPVIISYSIYFYYRIGKDFLACDENEGVLSAIAQENLAGVRVVRAFGKERSLKTHLAATWDGQTARIYVNGKCVAEDRHEKPLVRANGLNWGVGGPSYGLWGYPFATSGVHLWDSALSAAEVAELAKCVPVVPEAEVAKEWWDFAARVRHNWKWTAASF